MFNRKRPRKQQEEVNAGSMADIAFLLLIFFLVATTITNEKGLSMKLPPDPENQTKAPANERNVFNVKINSKNSLLVEGEVRSEIGNLQSEIERFIMNNGEDPNSSVSPAKAIVSLKTNRGTDYKMFIEILDEIKGAYFNIYGGRVGMTSEEYRSLKHDDPNQKDIYDRGKQGIPMNISIAEPDNL